MKKIISTSVVLSSVLFGAGYQIPNNSINSSALSTAYVANANGADAAYYNPANMVYNGSSNEIETALTYVSLASIYYDSTDDASHIKSKKHSAYIPSFHYASNELSSSGLRVGLSIVSPGGLSREWSDMPATATAKKFSLKTIEFNPSVAMPIIDKLSFGLGFRYLTAEAEAELDGSPTYTLKMDGKDSSTYGYNVALSYKPLNALNISATYRSGMMLNIDGSASATLATTPLVSDVSLETPIPANFILATAYTFETGTTVELTYDRTMWSTLKEVNFEFDNAILETNLGQATPRKWDDSNSYRIGITQEYKSATAMFGFSYNENPAADEYVSFSSPEVDTISVSLGGSYNVTDSVDVGLSFLYSEGKSRTVAQASPVGVNGELSNKNVYSMTTGARFKF